MQIEVDQSGKIEQTNTDTIVALSNDISYTVRLHRKDKRVLKSYFRATHVQGRSRYRVFAAVVAILLAQVKPSTGILLDNEYKGHEHFIRQHIMQYVQLLGITQSIPLHIGTIRQGSAADLLAGKVGAGVMAPNYTVKIAEVLMLLQT